MKDLHHEGVFTCLEDLKCLEDSNFFIFNHFFGSEYLDIEMELVSGKLSSKVLIQNWIKFPVANRFIKNDNLECRLKSAKAMEGFTCGNDATVRKGFLIDF